MLFADMTSTEWATVIGIFVAILGAVLLPLVAIGIKLMVGQGKIEVHMQNVEQSCSAMAADHKTLWEKYGEVAGKMTTHDVLIARLCDSAGISKD